MKVRCYWNLHKRLFSVVAREGPNKGRVIEHAGRILLRDVTPKVSEAGRQRVLREKRKNVHAYLEGTRVDPFAFTGPPYFVVEYSPYAGPYFRTWGYVGPGMDAHFDSRYQRRFVSAPLVELSAAGGYPHIRAQHPVLMEAT